jgi:hypothetical protein
VCTLDGDDGAVWWEGNDRVTWNQPHTRLGYRGPVRISTDTEEIPFLAAGRCLGDLWSYNAELDEFVVVSAEPDVGVIPVEDGCNRCLIFRIHRRLIVLSPSSAVAAVKEAERNNNEKHAEHP